MLIYGQNRQCIYDVCAVIVSQNGFIHGESAVLGNVVLGKYASFDEATSVIEDMFEYFTENSNKMYAMPKSSSVQ